MKKTLLLSILLWPVVALADPIIVLPSNVDIVWTGNAGVISRDKITGPITWTSTEHLRNACFAQWAPSSDSSATGIGSHPATCIYEDFVDGLFTYTLTLDQINLCEKAQPDTEKFAGGTQGVWIVVTSSESCSPEIRIKQDPDQPSPIPESKSIILLAIGLIIYIVIRKW